MSAPTSEVAICNLALDALGQKGSVSSIETPSSATEVICARHYDKVRRALLRKHPWLFAKTRGTISRSSTDPAFGFADAYNLPNDYIRLVFIGDDSVWDYKNNSDLYQIENGQILMDNSGASTLDIGYIFDQTNVTKFDPLFIEVLVLELAKAMSYKFTLKNSVVKRLKEDLNDARSEAKSVNGQDRPPIRIENSKFRSARKKMSSDVASPYTIFSE